VRDAVPGLIFLTNPPVTRVLHLQRLEHLQRWYYSQRRWTKWKFFGPALKFSRRLAD
jgi:hypothetical protein